MMKLRLTVAFLWLAALTLAHSKDDQAPDLDALKHPVKPMLWKVEGKGLKKPSYLFGTIHVADERVVALHPKAQKAFDQADTFFAEVDLSPDKQLTATQYYLRKDGKSLSDVIGDDLVAALDRELRAINPQLSSKALDPMKIWTIAATLPLLKDQMLGKKALDLQLWNKAKKAGKQTGAMETYKTQLGAMNSLSMKDQVKMLDVGLQLMKKSRELKVSSYRDLQNAYLLGDLQQIDAAMRASSWMGVEADKGVVERTLKLMLDGRNPGMAKSIMKALSSSDVESGFFAAGVGHYVGENNITDLLKAAGYQVTLVVD